VPSTATKDKPKILVIVGPTCSGKTAVSLGLAAKLNGEIISADSRQVYKHLDIGTAKPTPEERKAVKHYFVDELLPDQDFNAGRFGESGREIVGRILQQHKLPIVVGGSGLYVRSLIEGFFEGPGADDEFREAMENHITAGRIEYLLNELNRVDPVSAATIDPTKPRRIVRALEVYHLTGQPLSTLHREKRVQIDFQPLLYGLEWRRETLYCRIETRCEQMLASGLLHEVEHLEEMGYDDSLNALNTVGYAEAFSYRRGEMSYEEFVRLFKQNTRRYAKRQLTWFRSDKRIEWIEIDERRSTQDVIQEIKEKFLERASAR
jgi:tRNA dimethylallyltransferase